MRKRSNVRGRRREERATTGHGSLAYLLLKQTKNVVGVVSV
jgi:hypothetical protein